MKFFGTIKFPVSRFIVFDRSMEPKFREGDHVLTFNWARPVVDSVIVFKDSSAFYLKRVKDIGRNFVMVSSDNKLGEKTRKVSKAGIVGRVILKY